MFSIAVHWRPYEFLPDPPHSDSQLYDGKVLQWDVLVIAYRRGAISPMGSGEVEESVLYVFYAVEMLGNDLLRQE